MKQVRGDRGFWERLAREVDAGASKVSVAAKHGVSAWSVGQWCQRLAKERPQLLPVRVVEQRGRCLEIVAGSTRIAFEEGTSPDYIAAIARALDA